MKRTPPTRPTSAVSLKSEYTVPSWRMMEALQCSRWTLRNYEKRGMIPEGRVRPGVPGKFYTEAQANCLLRSLGRRERIHIQD